ncbi:MAG: MATE family efflux transporter [Candidatus Marinimicrobia bacterium]|nr:MATE family efflux transporter [Candidatus Neomarinimicrobiota bacterium]
MPQGKFTGVKFGAMNAAAAESRLDQFRSDPRKALWKLSLPVFGGMMIHTLYSVVDMVFVGRVGADAVAALAYNLPLVFFAYGTVMGLSSGVTAVLAQAIGGRDKSRADNIADHALVLGVVLGGILMVVGLLYGRPMLEMLGATGAVNELSWRYLQVVAIGLPFSVLSGFFRGILTGEGDTVRPMTILGVGMVLNIILDPIFIFGLDQGVRGAAIATTVSQAIVFVIFIYLIMIRRTSYVSFNLRAFKFSSIIMLSIFKIGLPASFSFMVMATGAAVYNKILASFSDHAVAAYQVASRIEMVYFLPLIALSTGCVTLVAMFHGAGATDEIKKIVGYTMSRAVIYGLVFAAIIIPLAPLVLTIFKPNAEILAYGVSYLRINALAFPIAPIGIISARVLQGMGKGLPFLVVTVLRVMAIGGPLAAYFTFVQHRPLEFVWISMAVSMVGGAAVGVTWLLMTFRSMPSSLIAEPPIEPAMEGAS